MKTVKKGDECTRDFLFGIGEEKQRSARLTAWFHTSQSYFVKVRYVLSLELCSLFAELNFKIISNCFSPGVREILAETEIVSLCFPNYDELISNQ